MDAISVRVIFVLTLLVNSTLDKHTPFRQETTRVDPVEYYGCVGVLIPSLRIIDSRTQDLVARPCLFLLFRFSSIVSFPSFGINNERWRLFYFLFPRQLFSAPVATLTHFQLKQTLTLVCKSSRAIWFQPISPIRFALYPSSLCL